jgi:disulfide oxidoreductase YuzD
MAKDFVAIKILDLPGAGGSCACSSTPRGQEFIATLMQKCDELKKALEASFPGQTSTEYVDISQSPEEKETEAGKLLVSKQYPSPLVVINGEARFAGSIQVNRVVKEVGKILNP